MTNDPTKPGPITTRVQTPTYQELLHPNRGGLNAFKDPISHMQPGDILRADRIRNDIKPDHAATQVRRAVSTLGLNQKEFVCRTVDRVMYVVRLKPEDMKQ